MSYDPSIGRWMQEDPIRFEGGDPNLFRFVGNKPINFTDPEGLQAAATATIATPNQSMNDISQTWLYFTTPRNYRQDVLGCDPRLNFTPQINNSTSAGAISARPGQGVTVTGVMPGQYVGTDGAASCIGVIIVTPDGKTVMAYHFQGNDDPFETLPRLGQLPNGSHVAVFAGNNDYFSNSSLLSVKQWLYHRCSTVIYDGYANMSGMFYNGTMTNGKPNYVTFTGDIPNLNYQK